MAPQKNRDQIDGGSNKSSHRKEDQQVKHLTPYMERELEFKSLPKKVQRRLSS